MGCKKMKGSEERMKQQMQKWKPIPRRSPIQLQTPPDSA